LHAETSRLPDETTPSKSIIIITRFHVMATTQHTASFDVFISHSASDAEVVEKLADCLTKQGLRVWYDRRSLRAGEDWQQQIREAVNRSRICLFVLSRDAVSSRPHVSQEWATIQESLWRRPDLSLCSLRVDDASTPPFLRPWKSYTIDVDDADSEKVDRALRQIAGLLHDGAASEAPKLDTERSVTARRFDELQTALTEESEASEGAKRDDT
jgi:hypothetical protein